MHCLQNKKDRLGEQSLYFKIRQLRNRDQNCINNSTYPQFLKTQIETEKNQSDQWYFCYPYPKHVTLVKISFYPDIHDPRT